MNNIWSLNIQNYFFLYHHYLMMKYFDLFSIFYIFLNKISVYSTYHHNLLTLVDLYVRNYEVKWGVLYWLNICLYSLLNIYQEFHTFFILCIAFTNILKSIICWISIAVTINYLIQNQQSNLMFQLLFDYIVVLFYQKMMIKLLEWTFLTLMHWFLRFNLM
jgi:hypothetical protein